MKKILTILICALILCGCSIKKISVDTVTDNTTIKEMTDITNTTDEETESVSEEIAETTREAITYEVSYASEETTTESPAETTGASPETNPPETEKAEDATKTAETTVTNNVIGKSQTGMDIETANGCTYVGGLLVANKSYPLPSTYSPGGLTSETYNAFIQMQGAASAEGIYIYVRSGFRSYNDQAWIYNGYVSTDGQESADTYSARPGHSEHQTGMAIDVNNTENSFAYSAEGIWLKEHCYEYGFIIRYPENKENITGYQYEPWHIRYVGKWVASAIKESGQCLEEYLGIDSVYK